MRQSYFEQCPDCHVGIGQHHAPGCDVEQCPYCGGQLLFHSCCEEAFSHEDGVPDADRIKWNGYWPGDQDCCRLGWAAKPVSRKWTACDPDDPDAQPDLNRLYLEATWDRDQKRFVTSEESTTLDPNFR